MPKIGIRKLREYQQRMQAKAALAGAEGARQYTVNKREGITLYCPPGIYQGASDLRYHGGKLMLDGKVIAERTHAL